MFFDNKTKNVTSHIFGKSILLSARIQGIINRNNLWAIKTSLRAIKEDQSLSQSFRPILQILEKETDHDLRRSKKINCHANKEHGIWR